VKLPKSLELELGPQHSFRDGLLGRSEYFPSTKPFLPNLPINKSIVVCRRGQELWETKQELSFVLG
jgi:hypothetical protein